MPNVQSRSLGLGTQIYGTKVVNNRSYAAAGTGELVDLPGQPEILLRNLSQILGQYRGSDRYSVPSESDSTQSHGEAQSGELLELYICEPPEYLQEITRKASKNLEHETAAVLFVTRCVHGTKNREAGRIWGVTNWIQSRNIGSNAESYFPTSLQMPSHDVVFD